MTLGTYSALLIKELIIGKYNEWAKLFDPSRVTLSAAKDFISETANMVLQYKFSSIKILYTKIVY